VEGGNHPDILVVEPDGQFIKVEQIRELQKRLGYKPFEGKATVCIVDGADRLNISAANSLLKTLEEPPAQTHLVLIAENIRMVIPTILSRCQRINFSPLPAEEVEELLKKDASFGEEDIKTIAAMSGGSPGKALNMAGAFPMEENYLLLKDFSSIDSVEKAFSVAEKLVAKDQVTQLMQKLELLKFFMRDVMLTKLGSGNKIVNANQKNIIVKRATQLTIKDIISKFEIISEAEKSIIMNANKRLAVETMLLKLFKERESLC
jgi:DNA polymerase-3 subunit delta'